MIVNLVKMAVGVRDTAHLAEIQANRMRQSGEPVHRHITRNAPKRAAELLDGGSLYWVIKGYVRVRQLVLGVERIVDAEARPSCALVLDAKLIRVELKSFKPFQGWRYFADDVAPPDAAQSKGMQRAMPEELTLELKELGLL